VKKSKGKSKKLEFAKTFVSPKGGIFCLFSIIKFSCFCDFKFNKNAVFLVIFSEWEVIENALALSAFVRSALVHRQLTTRLKNKLHDVANVGHSSRSDGGNRKRKSKTTKSS
jgi:hypothetical protein